jgi:hypothetical protein
MQMSKQFKNLIEEKATIPRTTKEIIPVLAFAAPRSYPISSLSSLPLSSLFFLSSSPLATPLNSHSHFSSSSASHIRVGKFSNATYTAGIEWHFRSSSSLFCRIPSATRKRTSKPSRRKRSHIRKRVYGSECSYFNSAESKEPDDGVPTSTGKQSVIKLKNQLKQIAPKSTPISLKCSANRGSSSST